MNPPDTTRPLHVIQGLSLPKGEADWSILTARRDSLGGPSPESTDRMEATIVDDSVMFHGLSPYPTPPSKIVGSIGEILSTVIGVTWRRRDGSRSEREWSPLSRDG